MGFIIQLSLELLNRTTSWIINNNLDDKMRNLKSEALALYFKPDIMVNIPFYTPLFPYSIPYSTP
jgi:hypothetical protein